MLTDISVVCCFLLNLQLSGVKFYDNKNIFVHLKHFIKQMASLSSIV